MARIGVQMMMLKAQVEQLGPFEVLRRLSEIGFHAVEVSQIPMTPENVAEMTRARDELGMEFAALSTAVGESANPANESLSERFDKVVADARQLGATRLRIGMMPFDAMGSRERLEAFCREADQMALRLQEHGITLYYHNHHIEFRRDGEQLLLDTIRDLAPNLRLEIDVHWVQRGGKDPARTLRRYDGLVDLVHLKDYRIADLPQEAFASLQQGDVQGFMQHFVGPQVIQFAEIGEGTLEWAEVIEAAEAAGAVHLLIEQDDQYGRDPFDALQTSHDNLVALGFGDRF